MRMTGASPPPQPSPPSQLGGDGENHRRIRSFVLRQGRFTPAQQRAFAEHWSGYGLDPDESNPDWRKHFGRAAPLVLEIGFGNGEQLLASAQNEPGKNFVGIDVHKPGVGRLMNALASHNVHNVRLYNHDAVDVLDRLFGTDSLDEVRIYFPDPWPKKRQQKRRLIQPAFVALVASRVKRGGLFRLATDWEEYAAHMLATIDAESDWRNTAGGRNFADRSPNRIETHFEKRGARLGHGTWDLVYERV